MNHAVHPRVCGELHLLPPWLRCAHGSSPRVRGTLCRRLRLRWDGRFIPACAGNSTTTRPRGRAPTVHPRVCGELAEPDRLAANRAGSSPRVRGTRLSPRWRCGVEAVHPRVCGELAPDQPLAVRIRRFIPACAGNSSCRAAAVPSAGGSSPRVRGTPPPRCPARCSATVHPRVCGELPLMVTSTASRAGSSPRVRGTPSPPKPAHLQQPVHPRVCGELTYLRSKGWMVGGSSPRVRGTRASPVAAGIRRRFIPACAGNSSCGFGLKRWATVHPRVCGELVSRVRAPRTGAGSSPRVRGTRRGEQAARVNNRFIPACAGNSVAHPGGAALAAVHPRVCGELVHPVRGAVRHCGSSPRVRGTPLRPAAAQFAQRFIPACAGNSSRRPTCARRWPVHPRVCGELDGNENATLGPGRFIPACAGNSTVSGWPTR